MLVSTEQQAYLQEPVLLCTLYSYKNPGGVGINHRGALVITNLHMQNRTHDIWGFMGTGEQLGIPHFER